MAISMGDNLMAGLPPDSRYVTAGVPPEMREGTELTEADVAKPTERIVAGVDGVTEQITQVRIPRPAHIPATPRFDALEPTDDTPIMLPRLSHALRYDFPLFPDVQVRVVFEGNATADHLEQLTELLNVQCQKLRAQEQRRRAEEAAMPRKTPARKVKPKKEQNDGRSQV